MEHKCIKVVLKDCLNMDIKEIKTIIRNMNYLSCKAANMAIDMLKDHTRKMIELKSKDKNFNEKQYCTQLYGKTYPNVIEGYMKQIMDICNTGNVGTLHQQLVQGDWKKCKNNVLNYRGNISTYKLDTPYFIKNNNYKLRNNGEYIVSIKLFSDKGLEQIGQKRGFMLDFKIDTMDGNQLSTIDKIVSGKYTQGSAQIKISKKGKMELIISFGFEVEHKPLNHNRILGVDLGIVNTATLSIWDENYQKWDNLKWSQRVIDGTEIIKFRQKIQQRRLNILRGSKLIEFNKGKCGHGRKTRTQGIDKLTERVENFRDTFNHKCSRYIVDFAYKNNCGVIQMEDLSGFSEGQSVRFLKEWSYYDLQSKIEYKAKELGIEVKKINPQYTSKRCSFCGAIHKENRNCKNNQAKFKCVVCNKYEDNADINASKNIAMKNIEEIINTYCTENNLSYK